MDVLIIILLVVFIIFIILGSIFLYRRYSNIKSTKKNINPYKKAPFYNTSIKPGESIYCNDNYNPRGEGAIYRYNGYGKIKAYANEEIASSWDPDWKRAKKIDCTGYTYEIIPHKLKNDNEDINKGDIIKCVGLGNNEFSREFSRELYRYDGKGVMSPLTPEIVSTIDTTKLPKKTTCFDFIVNLD